MEKMTIKGTAASVSEYLHEMRNAYGNGATVADALRNPAKAERIAAIFEAVEEINEDMKRKTINGKSN